jgi:NADH-quinone oxidoreductase subunit J
MNLGAGTESALITDIAFYVIAASIIISAIAVVHLRDIFRAALFLVVVFIGTAGLFILLRAEFLAVVQVIVYVGAISVLVLFAILMTQDTEQGSPPNRLRYPVGILAFLFGAAAWFVVVKTDWAQLQDVLPGEGGTQASGTLAAGTVSQINEVYGNTIPKIAELLLRDYVLAFEAVSVLLLAAVIGALALVKER